MVLLKNNTQSYIRIFIVGIFIGCLTRLLDFCSLDTLWSFSSIQTLLGFWIITNTMIVLFSSSNTVAALSSFLYMFGMTLSFYGLQTILGMYIPMFSDGFRLSLFLMFTILSIPCAVAAFVLFYWNEDKLYNSILYALPVGALFAETIAISINLIINHTFLFQFIMDLIFGSVFAVLFFKKAKSKWLYLISVIICLIIFYFALYHREVVTWL
jgi:hypothetical protein